MRIALVAVTALWRFAVRFSANTYVVDVVSSRNRLCCHHCQPTSGHVVTRASQRKIGGQYSTKSICEKGREIGTEKMGERGALCVVASTFGVLLEPRTLEWS